MNIKKQLLSKKNIAITLILLILTLLNCLTLTYHRPEEDRRQNLAYAYNTLKYKTFGSDSNEKPIPINYREPLYPSLLMIGIIIHPNLDITEQDAKCITQGHRGCMDSIVHLKIINKIFITLSAFLTALIIFRFTGSNIISIVCFCLVFFSASTNIHADRFKEEALASFLILVCSYLIMRLSNSKFSIKRSLLTGISFGLLVLTKAIYYHFVHVVFVLLIFWYLVNKYSIKQTLKISGCFILGAYIIIAPWIMRNYLTLNTLSISERGGKVLAFRASHLDMTYKEYLYFIANNIEDFLDNKTLFKSVIKSEEENTNYNKFKAKYSKKRYSRKYVESKIQYAKNNIGLTSRNDIDSFLIKDSLEKIENNFLYNLVFIIPLTIKGFTLERGFGLYPKTNNNISNKLFGFSTKHFNFDPRISLNIMFFFSFVSVIAYSLLKRNWNLMWFLLPALYCYSSYVVFTHVKKSYFVQLIPIFVLCSGLVMSKIANHWINSKK